MSDQVNPFASPQAENDEVAQPGEGAPEGVPSRELYRSPVGLGRSLRVVFWLLLVESVLGIASGLWYLATSESSWNAEELTAPELAELSVALMIIFTYLTGVVMYCKWKYRCYRNARAFGAEGLRFSPGWAVGYYFIPIANLFQPYRAMKDLFNGTNGDDVEKRAPVIENWWAGFIIMGFVDRISTRLSSKADTLEGVQVATGVEVLAALVTVVATLLVIRLVKQVDERQHKRAQILGWERDKSESPQFTIE